MLTSLVSRDFYLVCFGLLCLPAGVFSQTDASSNPLGVEIELPYAVLFPGENPPIKITVSNKSGRALTLPDPFYGMHIRLERGQGDRWGSLLSAPPELPVLAPAPEIVLAPGETRTATITLAESCQSGFSYECSVPGFSGKFRMYYVSRPGGGVREFTIENVYLERWAEVEIPGIITEIFTLHDVSGKAFTRRQERTQKVRVAILRHGDRRFLIATPAIMPDSNPIRAPLMVGGFLRHAFANYTRIAELSAEAEDLRVTLDSKGDAVVSVTERGKPVRILRVPAEKIRARKPEGR